MEKNAKDLTNAFNMKKITNSKLKRKMSSLQKLTFKKAFKNSLSIFSGS